MKLQDPLNNVMRNGSFAALGAAGRFARTLAQGLVHGLAATFGLAAWAWLLSVSIPALLYLLIVPWLLASTGSLAITAWLRNEALAITAGIVGSSAGIRDALVTGINARLPAGALTVPVNGAEQIIADALRSALGARFSAASSGIAAHIFAKLTGAIWRRVTGRIVAELRHHARALDTEVLSVEVVGSFVHARLAQALEHAVAAQLTPLIPLRAGVWLCIAGPFLLTAVVAVF